MKHWLQDNYGSRRGFVRTWLSRLLYMTGSYKPYKDVEWGSVGRLIFVCKGNICRSAYAEALVRSLGVEALSCGLNTRSDLPANDRAKEVASTRGVSLEVHRTTPIEECTPLKNDLFIAMEHSLVYGVVRLRHICRIHTEVRKNILINVSIE